MTNERKLALMEQLAQQYQQQKEQLWELTVTICTLYEEINEEDCGKAQAILESTGIEY